MHHMCCGCEWFVRSDNSTSQDVVHRSKTFRARGAFWRSAGQRRWWQCSSRDCQGGERCVGWRSYEGGNCDDTLLALWTYTLSCILVLHFFRQAVLIRTTTCLEKPGNVRNFPAVREVAGNYLVMLVKLLMANFMFWLDECLVDCCGFVSPALKILILIESLRTFFVRCSFIVHW